MSDANELNETTCPECGVPVPEGETCQTNFHALLYRESDVGQIAPDFFSTPAGQTAHFYAVSCYAIQHPESMRYKVETLLAARDNLAAHVRGERSLDQIRTSVRQDANGEQRVLRREGDKIHEWGVTVWPVTVADVLASPATPEGYAEATTRWARATVEALERGG